jgi:hypothetical protein
MDPLARISAAYAHHHAKDELHNIMERAARNFRASRGKAPATNSSQSSRQIIGAVQITSPDRYQPIIDIQS